MRLQDSAAELVFRVRQELRSVVTQYPALYLPVVRLGREVRDQAVHAGTEIVIEGFPRSGNSFTVDAFLAAQTRPVVVAHHLHAPAQIIAGVERGLPTLLLIRPPEDAVVSLRALQVQANQRDHRTPRTTSLRQLFRMYTRFHERVWPYRHGALVGRFEEVVADAGALIARVNTRYGTDFDVFEHTEANVRALRRGQRYHAAPSDERRAIMEGLQQELALARGTPEAEAARAIHAQLERYALQAD